MSKIAIVSSCGGHLTEIRLLLPAFACHEHFYILNHKAILSHDMVGKTFYISHSERDWKFILNLWEAFKLFKKNPAKIIISTGAGLIVPVSIIGKYLFRSKIIYIETIASIHKPTLSGIIMYHIADHFYYQWPSLKSYFPTGEYLDTLL